MREGLTQYHLEYQQASTEKLIDSSVAGQTFSNLRQIRDELRRFELIGEHDGLGYGNVSVLLHDEMLTAEALAGVVPARKNASDNVRGNASDSRSPVFLVSGTQTGHVLESSPADYSLVLHADPAGFTMSAAGSCKPSSEALTHASIYLANREVGAVIHIHNEKYWTYLINSGAKHTGEAPYGSREMIESINDLFANRNPEEKRTVGEVIVMPGHEGGVLCWGTDLNHAFRILMNSYKAMSD